MMNRRLLAGLGVGLLLTSVACTSRLTGVEGNLQFSYIADDDVRDFNKPIAPGAFLDIEVRTAGSGRSVLVESVRADPEVFEVTEISGRRFTLRALAEGDSLVQVEGQATGGPLLADAINLTAREPDVLKLSHTCVQGRTGLYLTGQRVLVPFELERSNGQAVIGYGRYPVAITDSLLLSLDASVKAQAFLHLDTGAAPGPVEIRSDIDATSLALEIVDPGSIDGAEVFFDNLIETDVGDTDSYVVLPTFRGQAICQARLAKSVVSTTPEVCTAIDRPASGSDPELPWLAVTGVGAGTCLVAVTYPNSGMSGFTTTVAIEIAP